MIRRVYIDTSVIGGVFDDEFSRHSTKLIEEFRLGLYLPVISMITIEELRNAPTHVRAKLSEIEQYGELVGVTEDAIKLSKLYIKEGKFTKRMLADTLHIAIATIERVDIVASWNFRDIVNLNRISVYNSVNLRLGYQLLEIRSPREIVHEEKI